MEQIITLKNNCEKHLIQFSEILEKEKQIFIDEWFKILKRINSFKLYDIISKQYKHFLSNKQFVNLLISFYKNENSIEKIYKHFNNFNEKRLEKTEYNKKV